MPKNTNKRKTVKKAILPEEKRLKAVLDGEVKLLKSNRVVRYVSLFFPNRKAGDLPLISKLAFKIIKLQGGEIGVRYEVLKKK